MGDNPMSDFAAISKKLRSSDKAVVTATITAVRQNLLHVSGDLHNIDLHGANLKDQDISAFSLVGADLTDADCSGALMYEINLEGATLLRTNISDARLEYAQLQEAKSLTVQQLRDAKTIEGCVLPDGTRLPGRLEMWEDEPDWQSPFDEWCEEIDVDEDGFITASSI